MTDSSKRGLKCSPKSPELLPMLISNLWEREIRNSPKRVCRGCSTSTPLKRRGVDLIVPTPHAVSSMARDGDTPFQLWSEQDFQGRKASWADPAPD